MTKRREGWYWVRLRDTGGEEKCKPVEWSLGDEFDKEGWVFDDMRSEVIGPPEVLEVFYRIPTPDEPWQCVPVEPTREMLESTGDTSASAYHGMLGAWKLMLAAAPKPEDG